jgi:hypothetical protein
VKSGEVVDFLPALLRHIPGPLWIIWDRRSAHRRQVARNFLSGPGERWWVEYLPGYAPELNPVAYIWAYGKQHALPSVCPKDYGSLDETAPNAEKNAAPSASHHGLLAAGRTVLLMSLYYAKLNSSSCMYVLTHFWLGDVPFCTSFPVGQLAFKLNCWLALAAPIGASPSRHHSQRQIRERIA